MVSGYSVGQDGTFQAMASVEDVRETWQGDSPTVWVDLGSPTEEDLKALGEIFGLDAEAIDDCLAGEQRPRMDDFSDYYFFILYGVLGTGDEIALSHRKLTIFFGERFLITTHFEPVRALEHAHKRCGRNRGSLLAKGVEHLFFTIVDNLIDNYVILTERLQTDLDALEERSLQSHVPASILSELSGIRADAVELRRLAAAQRELLVPLVYGQHAEFSENLRRDFSHVLHHITTVLELMDGLRETTHNVRDNYHAALANRMNGIMKVLTIFATILLPLAFITGFYGMNVPLWPDQDNPRTLWFIMGAMLLVVGGMLGFFRWRRWL